MAQGSDQKPAKRYRSFLENGDTYEAANLLNQVTMELREEKGAPAGSAAPLKPSKAYRMMRALLQDSITLDLLFTRALAAPQGYSEEEVLSLIGTLLSVGIALGYKEFSELLLRNVFFEKITPLVLHIADWLQTDRALKGGKDERTIVRAVFDVVLKAAGADMAKGAAFVTECGLLVKIRAHLPWKANPKLDPETAAQLSEILLAASAVVSMSVLVARERTQINALFASDDVMGWLQSVILWAGGAAERSARARAPLHRFVSNTFSSLAQSLQAFSLDAPQLQMNLEKLAPAAALAKKLKHNVSVSGAGVFLESLAHLRALQEAAQEPRGTFNASFQKAAKRGGRSQPVRELTLGERFVDMRDPRDVIGVNGELMGVREGDEQFSGQIDWGHVVRAFEEGDRKTVEKLLPTLAGFCVAASAGDVDFTRCERPPKAWAESMVALLESERCAGLWTKAGALASFFMFLHGAIFRREFFALDSLSEEDENWFVNLICRLMGWLHAKADRLCLQALQASCALMSDVLNLTWRTKLLAVHKAHYLEFGYAVFELLDRFATSASLAANTLLWQAGTDYMAGLFKFPVPQRTPGSLDVCESLLKKGACRRASWSGLSNKSRDNGTIPHTRC